MVTMTDTEEFVTFHAGGKPGMRRILRGAEAKPTFSAIPVIDFTNIDSPSLELRQALAKELYDACSQVGFFYAKGHGISEELFGETFQCLRRFFRELDEEVKMTAHLHKNPAIRGYEPMGETKLDPKSRGDVKEAFCMGDDALEPEQHYPSDLPLPAGIKPQNIWPENVPWFRQALYEYYSAVMPFSMKLVRLFALALRQESDTAFDDIFKFPITGMRALHYPPQGKVDDDGYIGLGAHSDFSWLTLVLQDDVPALEVLNANGLWISAPPIPGAFVCNVGQYLERHSNGIFPATVHRVRNMTGERRYSLPFFLTPDSDATIEPLASCIGEEGKKFEAINVGELYVRRVLPARHKHPTAIKYKDTPEEELVYSIMFQQ